MTTEKTTEKAKSKMKEPIKEFRITEKASVMSEKGCYVFNVAMDATKGQVKKQVIAKYKVTPVKVNMTITTKPTAYRGRPGKSLSSKKAYVYLKKGDKIEIA